MLYLSSYPVSKAREAFLFRQDIEYTHTFQLQEWPPGSHLVEIGVFCQDSLHEETREILRLESLTIRTWQVQTQVFHIGNLYGRQRQQGLNTGARLAWSWSNDSGIPWPAVLPWSATTGPFSHFTVTVNYDCIGLAYATEYPVNIGDWHDVDQIKVDIVGHLFGGGTVGSLTATFFKQDTWPAVENESRSMVSSTDEGDAQRPKEQREEQ